MQQFRGKRRRFHDGQRRSDIWIGCLRRILVGGRRERRIRLDSGEQRHAVRRR
jgi:hypothetical protein